MMCDVGGGGGGGGVWGGGGGENGDLGEGSSQHMIYDTT